MNRKTKNMNIIHYSNSMNKNLRLISSDKNLKELIQDMNNINNNILRYKQIENLLHYTTTSKNKEFEKKCDENILYKGALLEDMKLLQNRLYKTKRLSKMDNNIKVHKNNVKDVLRDIFGKSDAKQTRRYFPKSKFKLSHLKNLNNENLNFSDRLIDRPSKKNICVTERNINNLCRKEK
jgi:archaellum biogenesis ATPase FlaH